MEKNMRILVTGGAGFIGSHTVVALIEAGHTPYIVDNFSNSDRSMLDGLQKLTQTDVVCEVIDVRDTEKLTHFLKDNQIEAVIHFAALKAVGESIQKPLEYYDNNVNGLLSLLEAMREAHVTQLIFSSSATVYGEPDQVPIAEDAPLKPATNPYGASKQMGEQIVTDTCKATDIRAILLRYFNPVGAHPSGLIGELPIGIPNNLVPYVSQTAAGIREQLTVHGDDYDTPDGTGIRDYIHVVDLAHAHVKALDYLHAHDVNTDVFNIGTGQGSSVLEVVQTFERVNNVTVAHTIGPRRPGDLSSVYASADKAEKVLGWKAEKDIAQALVDTWNWQQNLSKKESK